MANYVRDFVARQPPGDRALVTIAADGTRREWTFGEVAAAAANAAAAWGLRRGMTFATYLGSRADYAFALLAGLHVGAVALPCSEQLRHKDLADRFARAGVELVVCGARNRAELDGLDVRVVDVDEQPVASSAEAPPFAELEPTDPAFVLFTSGTSGAPKLVTHGQRYVWGQQLQARDWFGAQPGELAWSTAAPGWSKSTRNSFMAPWFGGAAALLHDRRFDPDERLATLRAENVNVLCMAPTEYRLIAAHGDVATPPSLRRLVTAGEPPGRPVVDTWRSQTGITIADGYGQTETGHVTGVRPGETAPPGSMGRALPGVRVDIADGELVLDPATLPTFFLGYDGSPTPDGWWHTGDQVERDDDGYLYFRARVDDVILSAGYRIGPAEVESVLQGHPAVREVAVIGVPDEARGELVCAVVVTREPNAGTDVLAAELQALVKSETAPYKYPRVVRFVDELPKTNSGKIHRAALRGAS